MKFRLGLLILGIVAIVLTVPAFAQTEDDVRCGPGTIMRNGVCVLDETVEREDNTRMEEPMEETAQSETQQEQNEPSEEIEEQPIPDWVRQTVGWWSEGLITDSEFISAIEYLLERGIIQVITPQEAMLTQEIERLESENTRLESKLREAIDEIERLDDSMDSRSLNPITNNQTGIGELDPKDVLRDVSYRWSTNQMSDVQYLNEVQVLVTEKKIEGLNCTNTSTQTNSTIPVWVKNNAKWYGELIINYQDFLSGLQYLCNAKFLHK